jgi:tetratricopeptide (TPR) repeat protein
LLADEVVIVAANNRENLDGAKRIIDAITNPDNILIGEAPKINFVLSRVPFTDKAEDKNKEAILLNKVRRQYLNPGIGDINVIHSDRELEEKEQIKIAYEKDDAVSMISKDYLLLFEKLTKDDLSADEIARFNIIRESEKYFQLAISEDSPHEKLSFINKSIALNTNKIESYIVRASINIKLKQYDDALRDVNLAKNLNEKYIPALELDIEIKIDSKKYEDAKQAVEYLLKVDNTSYAGLYSKGILYLILKSFKDAIEIFGQLIDLYPESEEAYNARANAYRLNNEIELALRDVYKSLEINANYGIAYSTLAEINYTKGNMSEFYLNIENAFKYDGSDLMIDVIYEDPIYTNLFEDVRFMALLDKYDIRMKQ